jgi:alkylation response protein AidB-like acyl-CoA dehydrogenase
MNAPAPESLPAVVAPLLEGLAAGAEASDAARRLPADQASALAAAGVFRSTVPRALGGLETPLPELLEVIEAVGRRHGSAGWCVMIGATTALLSAYLEPDAAEEIYGRDPGVITGGAYAPTGRAVALPDGTLEVSGRWEWGSGSANCSWLLGGAMVVDGAGANVLDDAGLPEMRLCFAPAAEVDIVANWDVLGMQGTGSDDLVMDRVRVPRRRTVSLVNDRPWADGPLYRFPPFGLLALGIGAVALGVARSAMDAFVELAGGKVPMMSARVLGSRATVRAEAGRVEAELRAAAALYRLEVLDAWAAAESGGEFDVAQRAALRLAATHAATVAAEVCTRLHRLAGGTAVRHGQVLERALRDSHTATQHILVGWSLYETVGGVLLGAEPGMLEL